MKIRTAILLDNGEISKWQKDALEYAKDLLEIKAIINCNNTHIKRNLKKNFLYYILNCHLVILFVAYLLFVAA